MYLYSIHAVVFPRTTGNALLCRRRDWKRYNNKTNISVDSTSRGEERKITDEKKHNSQHFIYNFE